MPSISFFSKGITFKLSSPRKTSDWLQRISHKEGYKLESLTYVFCSDAFLKSLNKKYLKHFDYTDILSFDYSEEKRIIVGEIYISIPRVRENAKTYKQTFDMELRRVLAHGLLHFVGYDDKGPAQKAQMRLKEEACLSLWK